MYIIVSFSIQILRPFCTLPLHPRFPFFPSQGKLKRGLETTQEIRLISPGFPPFYPFLRGSQRGFLERGGQGVSTKLGICITNSSVPLCLRVQFIHPPNPLRRGTFAAKTALFPYIYSPPLGPPRLSTFPRFRGKFAGQYPTNNSPRGAFVLSSFSSSSPLTPLPFCTTTRENNMRKIAKPMPEGLKNPSTCIKRSKKITTG